MNRYPHIVLKNLYLGSTIYVLGSGASMNFIDPEFFRSRITIGTNSVWKYFPVKYCLFKHEQFIAEAIAAGVLVIASKHDCGDVRRQPIDSPDIPYIFSHKKGRFGELEDNFRENLEAIGKDDDIFVSYSSITSSLHLAAYMGAKHIIIAGHDCGWIDGKSHITDYDKHIRDYYKNEEAFNNEYNAWFKKINEQTILLKKKLIDVYDCRIYSLNPFVNFRNEGHKFQENIKNDT